jgi:hypothetical protein
MAIALALALTAGASASSSSHGTEDLRVTVAYVEPGHLLRVTITNASAVPLQMIDTFLPWGYSYSTQLVAIRPLSPFSGGQPLARTTAIDDAVGSRISIPPGKTLSGDISLDQQFSGLSAALTRDDMLLFWSYLPVYSSGATGSRSGGWLLLPKEPKRRDISSPDDKRMQRTAPGRVERPR